jgi:hypothetical protein
MFDHDYVEKLPADSLKAIARVCNDFVANFITTDLGSSNDEYSQPLAAWSLVLELCDRSEVSPPAVDFTGAEEANAQNIKEAISALGSEVSLEVTNQTLKTMRGKYAAQLEGVPLYEISDEDLFLVQQRLIDLRGLIQASDALNDDHRKRLLTRLEALQTVLQKKMSNLDGIFGFIFDLAALENQMGADAKPFMDRANDVARIASSAYAAAHQMRPSDLPQLLPGQSRPTLQDAVADALMDSKADFPERHGGF